LQYVPFDIATWGESWWWG